MKIEKIEINLLEGEYENWQNGEGGGDMERTNNSEFANFWNFDSLTN